MNVIVLTVLGQGASSVFSTPSVMSVRVPAEGMLLCLARSRHTLRAICNALHGSRPGVACRVVLPANVDQKSQRRAVECSRCYMHHPTCIWRRGSVNGAQSALSSMVKRGRHRNKLSAAGPRSGMLCRFCKDKQKSD